MVWIFRSGQSPAGRRIGSVSLGRVVYDSYVEQDHEDASGANSNTWNYVAFVGREPVLHGPLDLSSFTQYLIERNLLQPDYYVTSVELGNEVCSGAGIVGVPRFALRFEPDPQSRTPNP